MRGFDSSTRLIDSPANDNIFESGEYAMLNSLLDLAVVFEIRLTLCISVDVLIGEFEQDGL